MEYKFKFGEDEYTLGTDKLDYFVNDEENPVRGVDENKILEILNNSDKVDFTKAYFDLPCSECKSGIEEKKKVFEFIGYNFYIFTKNGEYILSNISEEYEGTSFNRLQRIGKIDNSYIVIVNVCRHCGSYSIEIEEFEL